MAAAKRRKTSRRQTPRNDAQVFLDSIAGVAASMAESRKHRVSMKLRDAATAAYSFGQTLDDLPNLRSYVEEASSAIDDLGQYIEGAEIRQMFTEARAYARQRPFLTLGAGVAAGIAASRLLAATPPGTGQRKARNGSRHA